MKKSIAEKEWSFLEIVFLTLCGIVLGGSLVGFLFICLNHIAGVL